MVAGHFSDLSVKGCFSRFTFKDAQAEKTHNIFPLFLKKNILSHIIPDYGSKYAQIRKVSVGHCVKLELETMANISDYGGNEADDRKIEEESLKERIQRNDQSAMNQVYEQYSEELIRFISIQL